jgi:hypothetical protein
MLFIYVRELQEEAPMDKKHWKRGKEEYAGSPILFYILQRSQGERNHQRKNQERNIRSMKTGGDIPTGGVILFPMMSKGEKEKDQKSKSQVHEVRNGLFREGILSGESLLVIDIKEKRNLERNMRRETCEEKEQKHEDRGRIPKERYPFPLMSKGERNIIDEE